MIYLLRPNLKFTNFENWQILNEKCREAKATLFICLTFIVFKA